MVTHVNLEVHQHLSDDVYSDRIRIPERFRSGIKEGRICKVSVGAESVLVEVRGIFKEGRPIVRLDEITRNKLGVECHETYDFTLRTVSIFGQFKWAWNAADSASRIAARLGVLGIVLGILGIGASLLPLFGKPLSADGDNGRYVFQHQQATANAPETFTVFDSRTGTVFTLVKSKDEQGDDALNWVEMHPSSGITITRGLDRQIEPRRKIPAGHK